MLLTEGLEPQIELEVPGALLAKITPDQRAALQTQLDAGGGLGGERLPITDRARLNITASRVGASINGTLVGTLSGQASVRLQELFQETVALSSIIDAQGGAKAVCIGGAAERHCARPKKTAQVRMDEPA